MGFYLERTNTHGTSPFPISYHWWNLMYHLLIILFFICELHACFLHDFQKMHSISRYLMGMTKNRSMQCLFLNLNCFVWASTENNAIDASQRMKWPCCLVRQARCSSRDFCLLSFKVFHLFLWFLFYYAIIFQKKISFSENFIKFF